MHGEFLTRTDTPIVRHTSSQMYNIVDFSRLGNSVQKLYVYGQQIDNHLSNNAGAVPEKKLRVVLFLSVAVTPLKLLLSCEVEGD